MAARGTPTDTLTRVRSGSDLCDVGTKVEQQPGEPNAIYNLRVLGAHAGYVAPAVECEKQCAQEGRNPRGIVLCVGVVGIVLYLGALYLGVSLAPALEL